MSSAEASLFLGVRDEDDVQFVGEAVWSGSLRIAQLLALRLMKSPLFPSDVTLRVRPVVHNEQDQSKQLQSPSKRLVELRSFTAEAAAVSAREIESASLISHYVWDVDQSRAILLEMCNTGDEAERSRLFGLATAAFNDPNENLLVCAKRDALRYGAMAPKITDLLDALNSELHDFAQEVYGRPDIGFAILSIGPLDAARAALDPYMDLEATQKPNETDSKTTTAAAVLPTPAGNQGVVPLKNPSGQFKQQTDTSKCPVVLGDANAGPLVLGKQKQPLSEAEYRVIKKLLENYPKGLTKDSLEHNDGGARRTLEKLRADPDWATVLPKPGRPGQGGYRIAWPT